MKDSKVLKVLLFIAGLMLIGVGSATLFAPEAFAARIPIDYGGDIGMLNDVRGSGGVLLGSGVLIMLGVFRASFRMFSTLTLSIIFLGFGLGRLASIGIDGLPPETQIKATVVEIIIGVLGVFALIKFRED